MEIWLLSKVSKPFSSIVLFAFLAHSLLPPLLLLSHVHLPEDLNGNYFFLRLSRTCEISFLGNRLQQGNFVRENLSLGKDFHDHFQENHIETVFGNHSSQLPHLIEKLPQWLSGPSPVLPAAGSPHRIPNRVKQCSDAQQFLFNYWHRLTKNA